MRCCSLEIILLIIFAVFGHACEHPNLFNDSEPEPVTTIPEVNSDEVIIHMKITGGPAAADHDLFIQNNRSLIIFDNYPDNGSLNRTMTAAEFDGLRQIFSENNFFSLQNEFAENDAADALLYEITFKQADLVHSITADYATASARARTIIDALLLHFNNLRNSLQIRLTTDKTEISTNRFLQIAMRVENRSDNELELIYTQGQAFDYVVYRISDSRITNLSVDNEVWRWSLNFSSSPVEKRLKIAPHQFEEFDKVTWNVQTDDKSRVTGLVAIVGELVSTPGGRSQTIQVKIN